VNGRDLDVLADLLASGLLSPAVETAFALNDVPATIAHLSTGRARGKAALTM
jgi:NADPH:quinone reductase-like Zn-dependent oxidoreductase